MDAHSRENGDGAYATALGARVSKAKLFLVKKENDRKIALRYNGDMDLFDESSSRMEGGKCAMAHQDKENDIGAGGKLQIPNSTVDLLVFTKHLKIMSKDLVPYWEEL